MSYSRQKTPPKQVAYMGQEDSAYPGIIFFDFDGKTSRNNCVISIPLVNKLIHLYYNSDTAEQKKEHPKSFISNMRPNVFAADIWMNGVLVQEYINVIFSQANPFLKGNLDPIKSKSIISFGRDPRLYTSFHSM